MKTLEQCKDEISRRHNYKSLDEMRAYFSFNVSLDQMLCVHDEAAELYASQFREPSTEQSGGTEQEIEKVLDWAKCGIYHNHAYNEDKLRDCLDVLERVMKLLNRKP